MSFRKYQPELEAKKKSGKNSVSVKRSYYTFSKYYPAGDTNRVYRKSISSARRIKKLRIRTVAVCVTVIIAVLLFIVLRSMIGA